MTTSTQTLAQTFLAAMRHRLVESLAQIEHCLAQLPDDDLYWRPFKTQKSLCNILLHLGGNLRQWMIAGVGGAPDERERQREFDERARIPREDLLRGLGHTVAEADAILAHLPPSTLTDARRIQGFETNVATAIVDTVGHFEGHAQEITYITRLRLGDRYVFRWTPQTPEQGRVGGSDEETERRSDEGEA